MGESGDGSDERRFSGTLERLHEVLSGKLEDSAANEVDCEAEVSVDTSENSD